MAAISFYGIPEQTIPAGGYVKLIVPDEITTYSTGISCLNVCIYIYFLIVKLLLGRLQ